MTNIDLHDALLRLKASTDDFHIRFNTPRDYDARVRVLVEECGELVRATTPEEIAEEAADVLVTAFGLMAIFDVAIDYNIVFSSMYNDMRLYWSPLYAARKAFHACIDLMEEVRDTEVLEGVNVYLNKIVHYATVIVTIEAINAVIEKNDKKRKPEYALNKHGKVVRV